jgi:arginyl-tRNA synthetase
MSETDLIRAELHRVARELGAPETLEPLLERPRDSGHGDWSSNVAMVLARHLRRNPMEIARDISGRINLAGAGVREATAAPPGFLNFRLDPGRFLSCLSDIIAADLSYGKGAVGGGQRVNVEFVSANPTGPLHVGHGRQAALGDAIATLLQWSGWSVSREFYYNDAGAQIERLAESVLVRAGEIAGVARDMPDGGYHGEYIRDIARSWTEQRSRGAGPAWLTRVRTFAERGLQGGRTSDPTLFDDARAFAVTALRAEQDLDLQAFGVRFDTYSLESALYEDGRVAQTIAALQAAGKTYEHEGALWLRTTEFGDDKDRVARKSDGSYTYFVPDVAYHITKWERGFRRAINVQGADHHSTVTRVRAGLQALDMHIPAAYPEYVLHQMVTVMRGGAEVKISKRAGSYVTVRDLIDEVGRDAVRYFFLMRKGDSPLAFDVDLARAQSEDNPVYYVQMAHARMCGIFRVGEVDRAGVTAAGVDLEVLTLPEEHDLAKALSAFPEQVESAADALEPHRITNYLYETSTKVHHWYHKAHVLLEGDDASTTSLRTARLVLARASQIVLRNGLTLLGLSTPERM